MSQINSHQEVEVNEWTVRPLCRTRKSDGTPYVRESAVEAQIADLSDGLPRTRLRKLIEAGSGTVAWHDARRIREETLVYFVREYFRRGDEQAAGQLMEILIKRVSAHVDRKIGAWRLSSGEAEECAHDLFAQMMGFVLDLAPASEFWEVRFWLCLDRKLYNLLEIRQAVRDHEIRPSDRAEGGETADEDGTIGRLLGQMADDGASPEEAAERQELMALLTENERGAVYHCFVQGLPEESDDPEKLSAAKLLGVTGRSVRNYLSRAKDKIARWQAGDAAAPPKKTK